MPNNLIENFSKYKNLKDILTHFSKQELIEITLSMVEKNKDNNKIIELENEYPDLRKELNNMDVNKLDEIIYAIVSSYKSSLDLIDNNAPVVINKA